MKDVAKLTGENIETVYQILKDFEKEANEVGVLKAAKNNEIDPTVIELINLSRELTKEEANIEKLYAGAKIQDKLAKFDLEVENLDDFLEEVYLSSLEQKINGTELIKMVSNYRKICDVENSNFTELKSKVEDLVTKHKDLIQTNEQLEKQIDKNRETIKKELEKNKTTEEQLKEFVNLNSKLLKNNIKIDQINLLLNLIENIETQGYDSQEVLKICQETKKIDKTVSELKNRKQKLDKEISEAMLKINSLQKNIQKEEEMLYSINQLKSHSLKPEQIKYIANLISSISRERGLKIEEAISKFSQDIRTSYNLKLGFDLELETLDAKWSALDNQVKQNKEELEALTDVLDSKRTAYKSLTKFQELGISEKDIENWEKILKANKYDIVDFRKEIEKLDGLDIIVQEKNRQILELEAREKSLKKDLEYIKEQITNSKKSIEEVYEEIYEILKKELVRFKNE